MYYADTGTHCTVTIIYTGCYGRKRAVLIVGEKKDLSTENSTAIQDSKIAPILSPFCGVNPSIGTMSEIH
jgi:hypothetical protein